MNDKATKRSCPVEWREVVTVNGKREGGLRTRRVFKMTVIKSNGDVIEYKDDKLPGKIVLDSGVSQEAQDGVMEIFEAPRRSQKKPALSGRSHSAAIGVGAIGFFAARGLIEAIASLANAMQ